jgi:hypothetical protein
MFNSGVIAASGVTSGYSANLEVRSATDKFGTRYGFLSDHTTTPTWGQQGSGSASVAKYGNLDNVFVTLGGTDYRVVGFTRFIVSTQIILLHPDHTDSTMLAADLFSSVSTDLGTLNSSDTTRQVIALGGTYNTTSYYWTTAGTTIYPDIIGTSNTTRTLTITE